MATIHRRILALALASALALGSGGCSDSEGGGGTDADPSPGERQQLIKQIEELQRQREQDRRVLEARRLEAEADASTAQTIMMTTACGLVLVIFLLVHERRKRQVLERLVQMRQGNPTEWRQ